MINFAPAKRKYMLQTLIISTLIIAVAMALLCIKLLLRRNGRFSSMHIHDSEPMRQRGIHCVLEQDREQRKKKLKK